ncbi:hypothetical protein B0H34DRAFT_654844, partial [Crassisporium funariophilum]
SSIKLGADRFEFSLPSHKADHFFEGDHVPVIEKGGVTNPVHHFQKYLTS